MAAASNISVCVCILAHNEEKHIESTMAATCRAREIDDIPIFVYANGCTDATAQVVKRFACRHRNVQLCELTQASKPGAWNAAFSEREYDYIVFSDADIIPDQGAVQRLVRELASSPRAVIASCRQIPRAQGVTLQQKLVGFMQIPLVQTFLAGGCYAVKRQALAELMAQKGFQGLPAGVAGDDAFLHYLVAPDRLIVSETRSAYTPPDFEDYCRYLARIRWQNEQIRRCWGDIVPEQSWTELLALKVRMCNDFGRVPVAALAVLTRCLFKLANAARLRRHLEAIGPVRTDGAAVLSDATRSFSTR